MPKPNLHTTQILIVSFASAILAGTLLLMLPFSTVGKPLSFIDSLFMATSAACVTGLSLVDVGQKFTLQGQCVLLILIQLGGLGIMTFSTIIVFFTGKHLPLKEKTILKDSFVQFSSKELFSIIKYVFVLTFLIECAGSAILFIKFKHLYPLKKAIYYSFFHSISAFCNAGFSLFSQGLIQFKNDAVITMPIALLIILGGLGFFVLLEIRNLIINKNKTKRKRISLHSKIVLSTSAILLAAGTVAFFILEHNNSLQNFTFTQKVLHSFFQSATIRTAGFSTVDFGLLTNTSLFIAIMLMFIGASPGSTGGGIKTTSLGIFFAMIRAKLLARDDISIFKRTINNETLSKSISIVFSSVFIILIFCVFLLMSELGYQTIKETKGRFFEIIFEVFSAFGTVGLSTGYTKDLTPIGRVLITIIMFIGRVGPLTVASAVSKKRAKGIFRYSEESVMVG